MLIWSFVLFGLGILAVLDSQFNYGYLFRSANSLLFMLISLGLLVRTRILRKLGYKEQLLQTINHLRSQVQDHRTSNVSEAKTEVGHEVVV
jgi:hypothetical protein